MNAIPNWSLSTLYLRQVADQMNEMGVPVGPWLADHCLSEDELDEKDAAIPWETVRALFMDAQSITGEAGLGLMLGERLRISSHGVVGYAAMNSGSVRQVIGLLEKFLPLRINLIQVRHQQQGKFLNLEFHELLPLSEVGPFVLGAVLVAVKNVLDFITLGRCQVAQVCFTFAPVFDRKMVETIFRCPVRYRQRWTGLSIPLEILDQPLRTADPAAFEHAEALCERELESMSCDSTITARVRRLMLFRQVNFPSLDMTARMLNMTPRTLHRRLKKEGTSFQEILDTVRHALAMEYLKSRDITIQELAYTLGYGDTANFRRAFKRWTGVAPSLVRG